MKIKLPILYYTDQGAELYEAGLDVPESENEIRDVLFYEITSVHPDTNSDDRCVIHSGGDSYVCDLPMKAVETILFNSRVWN